MNRYLNNKDYGAIITESALEQIVRGDESLLAKSEEAAKASIVEYLSEKYEIEKTFAEGEAILEYNTQITYPVDSHFYLDGEIYKAIRAINSRKRPSNIVYWEEYVGTMSVESILPYKQMGDYAPGDVVNFANSFFVCLEYNGLTYNNIQIPTSHGWRKVESYEWEGNVPYNQWDVVTYEGSFYALHNMEGLDLTKNPYNSPNWGLIAQYDESFNKYENSPYEYVTYKGAVYVPEIDVNSDLPREGFNIIKHDPRNSNIKKHMLRLSVYELHKLISPNNISAVRITDYEDTMKWLRDANALKINPQIPRRVSEDNKNVASFAIATFMRDYDPYKNPWQI